LLESDDLLVDVAARLVYKKGSNGERIQLDLTAKEFDLLALLLENRGRTLRKQTLLDHVWGASNESEPSTLTVHIKWLRDKIERDPRNPVLITTVWGVGYRYE
jgi:DNA-binding response OmpR family regulator